MSQETQDKDQPQTEAGESPLAFWPSMKEMSVSWSISTTSRLGPRYRCRQERSPV